MYIAFHPFVSCPLLQLAISFFQLLLLLQLAIRRLPFNCPHSACPHAQSALSRPPARTTFPFPFPGPLPLALPLASPKTAFAASCRSVTHSDLALPLRSCVGGACWCWVAMICAVQPQFAVVFPQLPAAWQPLLFSAAQPLRLANQSCLAAHLLQLFIRLFLSTPCSISSIFGSAARTLQLASWPLLIAYLAACHLFWS